VSKGLVIPSSGLKFSGPTYSFTLYPNSVVRRIHLTDAEQIEVNKKQAAAAVK